MPKYISLIILFQCYSCTDQFNPISYSISNNSDRNLMLMLYKKPNLIDTVVINDSENKILSKDVPPYDNGPFGGYDSLTVVFDDSKKITYSPLKSNSDCIDSIKNPFCPYSHYTCANNVCTFDIDAKEYLRAK